MYHVTRQSISTVSFCHFRPCGKKYLIDYLRKALDKCTCWVVFSIQEIDQTRLPNGKWNNTLKKKLIKKNLYIINSALLSFLNKDLKLYDILISVDI